MDAMTEFIQELRGNEIKRFMTSGESKVYTLNTGVSNFPIIFAMELFIEAIMQIICDK